MIDYELSLCILCFDLGVDYDSLRSEVKEGKALERLVAAIRHERGDVI
jgi:hypothetical protein